jgi:hypothetical protein
MKTHETNVHFQEMLVAMGLLVGEHPGESDESYMYFNRDIENASPPSHHSPFHKVDSDKGLDSESDLGEKGFSHHGST